MLLPNNPQVLSKSVAEAIALENDESLKECERFVKNFNKFFDIMNIRCTTEYIHSRNSDKKPFYGADDERLMVSQIFVINYMTLRLQWLKNNLLGYLNEWSESVNNRQGFNKKQKEAMMLSKETIQGLKITSKLT